MLAEHCLKALSDPVCERPVTRLSVSTFAPTYIKWVSLQSLSSETVTFLLGSLVLVYIDGERKKQQDA